MIPGSGRSPEDGHDNPLQYSCQESPVDRGAWRLQSMGWGGGEAGHKELDTTEVTEHACVQYMENYPNLLTLFGFYFNILLLLCQIHILIHSVYMF